MQSADVREIETELKRLMGGLARVDREQVQKAWVQAQMLADQLEVLERLGIWRKEPTQGADTMTMKPAAEWLDEWPEGPCKTIDQVDFLQQATPEQAERFILAIQRDAAGAQRAADIATLDANDCRVGGHILTTAPLVTLPKGEG